MKDLALNVLTHDLDLPAFDLVLIDGADEIAQNLRIRLKLFRGEWYLDTLAGVPYYQSILIKNPSEAQLAAILKEAILTVPGVDELLSFTLDFDALTRRLTLDFRVSTVAGEISLVEVL